MRCPPYTLRQMGKVLGGRAPELGVAEVAGEEEEFEGRYGQWSYLYAEKWATLSTVDKAAPLSTLRA